MSDRPGQSPVSPGEAATLAEEAFVFGMPPVYIAVQVETMTNVATPGPGRAPLNQFGHFRQLPDASAQVVVGLNVDTLYSLASLDLSGGPVILSVPQMGDRYWLMQLIDAWNNVPHDPGSRILGGDGGDFAIVGPGWTGELPEGVSELRMPTTLALVGGRTYVSGPDDYPAVHALQDQYRLVPLQAWGTSWMPPAEVPVQPGIDAATPVPRQILAMGPETFFGRLNALLPANPPYPADAPVMERIARLGITPGAAFPWASFAPAVQEAISKGVEAGKQAVRAQEAHLGEHVNGWQMALDMGRYGTRYAYRAAWTFFGVGGNLIEDACYPLAVTDGQGDPLDSSHGYTLHFGPGQIPPVNAFWSLTMYDPESYLVPNPINRYALGDRSGLTYADDGSLTLYIQREKPGASRETNWLPAPEEGRFKLALRLYSPKPQVAQGTWKPPPIKRAD
jgi:hypothetical protein